MTASRKQTDTSVIIPAYADPDGLQTTLDCAIKQNNNLFEVIVSITPSSGETIEVAEEYASMYPDLLRIVTVEEKGRARARNAGIDVAKGTIIVFIDANIQFPPNWLDTVVSDLKAKRADYLSCNVVISPITEDGSFVENYDRALSIPVNHYIENYHFAPTAALLVTRDLLEDVGTFDPELLSGEDREFGNRVYEQGYDLCMSDCVVYHPPRTTVSEQIHKAIRIGIGLEQLRCRYPDRYSFPSLISPFSYAPPDPTRLNSRLSSNSYEPDPLEWVVFYLFNYILKLFQQLGRWKHYCSRS